LNGIWKRTFTPRAAGIELQTYRPLAKAERTAVDKAVKRYEQFLELPVTLSTSALARG
jgi:hypothetical protein